LALLPQIPTMSTGKNVRPVSTPTKAQQPFYEAAARWWRRQTLGQLAALAAITLGVSAATVADAQMGRSDSRGGAPALRNLSSTPAATTSASPQTSRSAADPPRPRAFGTVPTPPAPAAPAPASQVGVPLTELAPIAPLSSSTSSSTAVPTALPTGGSSGVPLSAPGGGREGLAACLEFWDKATHMTKAEWKAACERSVHRLETITGTKKP